ncbi:MAG: class I poly(R)-hydroxyalkanoic acid synthase, partial [Candidatus Competibacterales bacterium]|nr:class I poly(R)-hydroxyalkanoic acid synthase [Candidatus Competibacterales bacterium]
ERMLSDPSRLLEAQSEYYQNMMNLWQWTAQRMQGEETPPVIQPEPGDKRFKDETWSENPYFEFLKQAYLLSARSILHSVRDAKEGLDAKTAEKVDFYTRQYLDALSPTNFPQTNPRVLRTTMESGGENLLKGLEHLLEDLNRGRGELRIRMTDLEAFRLGENIAVTPGKVIFQTPLMQLIQYTPTTEQVYQRPLLIVPPWINKYYILDLKPKNSFIKWAVDQGFTVFVISWVNPDESLADRDFEDYLLEGTLAALEAVEKITGEKEVNTIGYCIGGTLLMCTLGYLAATGQEDRVKSATFFTTLIDFTDVGELSVFIDEEQVELMEQQMERQGYLEGSQMANVFNMLRANDLIWSFYVNNYLLGKEPMAFDLLYWNSDSTRMPRKMHSFYLRNMYLNNRLREPGGIDLAGEPIDLRKIRTPQYFVSTREDHIAPWKGTYRGVHLTNGQVKFVLGGSGHIAGVVNPPDRNKYGYWTYGKLPDTPDEWLNNASYNEGSWWPDWLAWVKRRAGKEVPARVPGDGPFDPIEDAPGSYVKMRIDKPAE